MEKMIETIVNAIQDKKGKDIVSLDLTGFDGAICSHFIVCNADSTAQVAGIADGVEEAGREGMAHRGSAERLLDRDGLPGCGSTHLPDRAQRVLPLGGVMG